MSPELKRLCEVALYEAQYQLGGHIRPDAAEAIARAILIELREPSPGARIGPTDRLLRDHIDKILGEPPRA